MKSLTGKFTSVRRWPLLLALLLGAGLMISACGDEEVPTPTTPAPTPPPTPTPPTPTPTPPPEPEPEGLAAPTGLRVSEKGRDFIEWSWTTVEGATGYGAQFSTDGEFTDADNVVLVSGTSHRISNLDASASGYLRVQAIAVEGSEIMRSEWTEAVSGTTAAPPPAVPLDVPSGLSVTDRDRDALTLGWNSVLGAATYQVQQRIDDAAWSSASCGGADNQVDGTECVASGLTAGTEYDFRVRAAPAADDTATLAVSSWSSTASATTTGRAAITIDDGGLNLQWKSEGTTITWIWDPVEDRSLQPLVDSYAALLDPANDECPSFGPAATGELTLQAWRNLQSDTSVTLDVTGQGERGQGATRGLCVVWTWEDERKIRQFGNVSVAWASTPPGTAEAIAPRKRESDTMRSTTSITWDYEIDEGFTYILRLLSTSRDGDPPGDIADCSGGDDVASPAAVNSDDFTTSYGLSDPDPYTHYRLCIQAENDTGASDWAFVGGNVETRPAAPSAPSYEAGESEVVTEEYGGATVTRLVWSVDHRDGTPLDGMRITTFNGTLPFQGIEVSPPTAFRVRVTTHGHGPSV